MLAFWLATFYAAAAVAADSNYGEQESALKRKSRGGSGIHKITGNWSWLNVFLWSK